MALPTQPYKGARDFYPADKRIQKYIFAKWRTVCERFGYEEYDAPILEPTDLFLVKGNQEIVDEQTYTFLDRSERSLTIRTEMTPTVSRMVAARRQELIYPLRWYSIPNLWRYERPQRGRLREFWQLNVDLFGVPGIAADHEMIVLAYALMREFGAHPEDFVIRLNSRKLIDSVVKDYLELDSVQAPTLMRLIDKMHKMDDVAFLAAAEAVFSPTQRDSGAVKKLEDLLKINDVSRLPDALIGHPSVGELANLIKMLHESGVENMQFDMSLMRGFDYYTDIVFEVFDTNPENKRSMFGGGRYDGLVGVFGVEPVATVGFGMGDVVLQNFLETHKLLPDLPTETEVYVILVGDVYERSQRMLSHLRGMGVNVAVDTTGRKLDKQLRSAIKKNIPFALFVGEKELETEQYRLKNLAANKEETHGLERISSLIKDYRKTGKTVEDELL